MVAVSAFQEDSAERLCGMDCGPTDLNSVDFALRAATGGQVENNIVLASRINLPMLGVKIKWSNSGPLGVRDAILGFPHPRFVATRAPVSFFNKAFASSMPVFTEAVCPKGLALGQTVEDTSKWQYY